MHTIKIFILYTTYNTPSMIKLLSSFIIDEESEGSILLHKDGNEAELKQILDKIHYTATGIRLGEQMFSFNYNDIVGHLQKI